MLIRTLNPYEHGECYVTDDGAETDLDLGHYERFLNVPTSQANNVTTGRIYLSVIEKREEESFRKTVQVVPHITNEIKGMQLLGNSGDYDIVITEIGGTVGDIILALYRVCSSNGVGFRRACYRDSFNFSALFSAAGELKTKPTQHSVKH
jgi:CTP synthase